MIRALVFDFDGLILETETPIFVAWQELFRRHNCELTTEQWLHNIGTADEPFDPIAEMQRQAGRPLELAAELQWRTGREAELIALEPPLPGVVDYLQDAQRLGLRVGLASSSSCGWVTGHLERLGLRPYFQAILGRDDVSHTKPDPELYRVAAARLGVAPSEALAFEDSLHGIRSAQAAGMRCVAVPNPLTRFLSLEEADLQLASLADLPLEALLQHFNR